jgi:hypothetical protein
MGAFFFGTGTLVVGTEVSGQGFPIVPEGTRLPEASSLTLVANITVTDARETNFD